MKTIEPKPVNKDFEELMESYTDIQKQLHEAKLAAAKETKENPDNKELEQKYSVLQQKSETSKEKAKDIVKGDENSMNLAFYRLYSVYMYYTRYKGEYDKATKDNDMDKMLSFFGIEKVAAEQAVNKQNELIKLQKAALENKSKAPNNVEEANEKANKEVEDGEEEVEDAEEEVEDAEEELKYNKEELKYKEEEYKQRQEDLRVISDLLEAQVGNGKVAEFLINMLQKSEQVLPHQADVFQSKYEIHQNHQSEFEKAKEITEELHALQVIKDFKELKGKLEKDSNDKQLLESFKNNIPTYNQYKQELNNLLKSREQRIKMMTNNLETMKSSIEQFKEDPTKEKLEKIQNIIKQTDKRDYDRECAGALTNLNTMKVLNEFEDTEKTRQSLHNANIAYQNARMKAREFGKECGEMNDLADNPNNLVNENLEKNADPEKIIKHLKENLIKAHLNSKMEDVNMEGLGFKLLKKVEEAGGVDKAFDMLLNTFLTGTPTPSSTAAPTPSSTAAPTPSPPPAPTPNSPAASAPSTDDDFPRKAEEKWEEYLKKEIERINEEKKGEKTNIDRLIKKLKHQKDTKIKEFKSQAMLERIQKLNKKDNKSEQDKKQLQKLRQELLCLCLDDMVESKAAMKVSMPMGGQRVLQAAVAQNLNRVVHKVFRPARHAPTEYNKSVFSINALRYISKVQGACGETSAPHRSYLMAYETVRKMQSELKLHKLGKKGPFLNRRQ